MSGENEMVDEELVGGGEAGSAKVAPSPDAATMEGKTMTDAESTENESQFALFLVLIASVVLVVATGAAYDWDIRVSRFQILPNTHPPLCIPVAYCSVLIITHAT